MFSTEAIALGWLRNSLMGYLLPPRTSSYVGSLTLSFFAANKFAFFELESDEVTALMSIFFLKVKKSWIKVVTLRKDQNLQELRHTIQQKRKLIENKQININLTSLIKQKEKGATANIHSKQCICKWKKKYYKWKSRICQHINGNLVSMINHNTNKVLQEVLIIEHYCRDRGSPGKSL